MTATARLTAQVQSAYGSRPGVTPPVHDHLAGTATSASDGLDLSDIVQKKRTDLRPNPVNEVFRRLKTEVYFRDLERDIREAGAIINPLIIMPDGLIIEGESRLIVAERIGIERLPCRVVLSPMPPEEQERRLWLGNLSRFEVDEDTRLLLYSLIWPGYFSGSGDAPKVAEIAEAVGKTPRQVKRDKAVVQAASRIAEEQGHEVSVEDIEAARAEKNEARRTTGKAPDEVILRVRRVLEKLMVSRATTVVDEEISVYDYAIELLEEALR